MGWGWDNILPDEFDPFIQYLRLQKAITVSRFGWKSSNWICPVIVPLFVIPLCKIQSQGKIGWRNQAGFTLSRIASISYFKMFHVKKIQWKPIKYNFRRLLRIRDGNFGCQYIFDIQITSEFCQFIFKKVIIFGITCLFWCWKGNELLPQMFPISDHLFWQAHKWTQAHPQIWLKDRCKDLNSIYNYHSSDTVPPRYLSFCYSDCTLMLIPRQFKMEMFTKKVTFFR